MLQGRLYGMPAREAHTRAGELLGRLDLAGTERRLTGTLSGGQRRRLDITLFLTTHYLDEADALCDRILVIDNGRIVAEGSPEELKRTIAGDTVELGTGAPARTAQLVQSLPEVTGLALEGATVRFQVPRGSTALPVLLRRLDTAGIALKSIEVHRPTLDDVFLTLTGRSLRDADSNAPDAAATPEPALPAS